MQRVRFWLIRLMVLLPLSWAACSADSPAPTGTAPVEVQTAIPASATVAPSPTPSVPVGILLRPDGGEEYFGPESEAAIKAGIQEQGLRYQTRDTLRAVDFNEDEILYVVVLPPYPDLAELAASAPGTSFLGVGFDDLDPADNLSVIRSGKADLDIQGFVAGYISAMITPDWRVASVGLSGDQPSEAARQGFVVGVKYLCGLCLPKYAPTGPNYLYPKYVELSPEGTAGEHQAEIQVLLNRAVETIYVVPGTVDPELFDFLISSGVVLIGDGSDYRPEYSSQWAASLAFDFGGALADYLPEFFSGAVGDVIQVPLSIRDVNPDLLSPGKLNAAQSILEEVSAGWISTSQE